MGRQIKNKSCKLDEGQQGYTIIELVLVVAVTSLMLMGVFANASGRNADRQYYEGVELFRDFIASQYEDVASFKNSGVRGDIATESSCSGRVGQSNCLYVGRYIMFQNKGDITQAVSFPIIADIAEPRHAQLGRSGFSPSVNWAKAVTGEFAEGNMSHYYGDWGVQAYHPGSQSRHFGSGGEGLAILRSPRTGQIASYAVETPGVNPTDETLPSALTEESGDSFLAKILNGESDASADGAQVVSGDNYICLKGSRGAQGIDLAVKISERAVDQSGVTVESEKDGSPVCAGGI